MMSKNFLEEFNIRLNLDDLDQIKNIINNPSDWADGTICMSFKYKLLKVSNNEFYLVGKGKKAGVKNAFQASGMHGTVKGAIKITLENNEPVLHKEKPYFVKRLRDHEGESESVIFKAEHQECFFIKVPHKNKNYIIMPKVLGTPLNKLDYKNQDQKFVKRLITSALRKILEFHSKGYVHNDIKEDNILYDISSEQLNLIDFGNSNELSKDELRNENKVKLRDIERFGDYDDLLNLIIRPILFNYVSQKLLPIEALGIQKLSAVGWHTKKFELADFFIKIFEPIMIKGFCGELTQEKIDNSVTELEDELNKVNFDSYVLSLNKIIKSSCSPIEKKPSEKLDPQVVYNKLVQSLNTQLQHYENIVKSRLYQRQSPDRKLILTLIREKIEQLDKHSSMDHGIKLIELIGFLKGCRNRVQSSHTSGFFGFIGHLFTNSNLFLCINKALNLEVQHSLIDWVEPNQKEVDEALEAKKRTNTRSTQYPCLLS